MSEEMMDHRVHEWLASNNLRAEEVRHGSFPLGMVQRFIERAESAEAELNLHREFFAADQECFRLRNTPRSERDHDWIVATSKANHRRSAARSKLHELTKARGKA